MNELDYDAMLKKRIARSAFRKVGNRKGCTLPSDYMTTREKNLKNGEVKTMQMNQPMEWKEYRSLPEDLRREYFLNTTAKFGVGAREMALMFGVSPSAVFQFNRTHGIRAEKIHRPSEAETEAFLEWATGSEPEEIPEEPRPEEQGGSEPATNLTGSLSGYNFEWADVSDWNEILKFVSNMPLPEGARVRITVTRGGE